MKFNRSYIAAGYCCAMLVFSDVMGQQSTSETDGAINSLQTETVKLALGDSSILVDKSDSGSVDLSTRTQNQGSGHLNLFFRNYAEDINIGGIGDRHAWVQSLQANYSSGYTNGAIEYGLDISPYLAVKLDGGSGAHNMILWRADGQGQNQDAWAYFGQYLVKVKFADVTVKYGLQSVPNPMLSPYNIRALPPTFNGIGLVSTPNDWLTVQAGSFDAVNARGDTNLRPLTTTVGGTVVSRFDYVGAQLLYSDEGRILTYANNAENVWKQYYLSISQGWAERHGIKWNTGGDIYVTHSQGKSLQGDIDNKAMSLWLSGTYGASTITTGFQRIFGENYFDYIQESNGVYLANSMGVDYNAPNEHSVKFQYGVDGENWGMPGFNLTTWGVHGWGAKAPNHARQYSEVDSLLYNLYWVNGAPISGGHHEVGLTLSQIVQNGKGKGAKVSLTVNIHHEDKNYPSRNFDDLALTVDVPFQVF